MSTPSPGLTLSRVPLSSLNPNSASTAGTVGKSQSRVYQYVKLTATEDDRKLLSKVSAHAESMSRLTLGQSADNTYQASAGAAALRFLGYDLDESGSVTYNPTVGVNAHVQQLSTALHAEQQGGAQMHARYEQALVAERAQNAALADQMNQVWQQSARLLMTPCFQD